MSPTSFCRRGLTSLVGARWRMVAGSNLTEAAHCEVPGALTGSPRVQPTRALARREPRELSRSAGRRSSFRSKRWTAPEGLKARAAPCRHRRRGDGAYRRLLRVLWEAGARVSEALALRPMDLRADSLVTEPQNPDQPVKRVFIPSGHGRSTW
jgi:hypothetical protein